MVVGIRLEDPETCGENIDRFIVECKSGKIAVHEKRKGLLVVEVVD
jgi:hypothetical protein